MLTNFFGKSKPINALILVACFFLLFSTAILSDKISFNWPSLLLLLLTLGIVKFINERNNLTFDNYFTLLFFVLLLGAFPKTMTLTSTLYTNIILLLFFRKLYSIQTLKNLYKKIFDAGFWLGISFLIEPFSVIFIVLLYFAIYLHNKIVTRTLLIPLLGFSVPVILFFTYCFWFDNLPFFENLFICKTNHKLNLYQQKQFLIPVVVLSFLIILSIFSKTKKALAVNNAFKSNWILIVTHLLFAGLLIFSVSTDNEVAMLFLLFPAAVILANGLEIYQKKVFSEIIIILITTAILISTLI